MSVFYHFWKVWLWSNHPLMKKGKGYMAEISSARLVKNNQDIAEQLANETDINYNTLIYIINQYDRTMCEMLSEGYTVNTGNLILAPAITGEWNEKELEFQPEKHKRIIKCRPTEKMIQALEFVGVKVMGTKDIFSSISQIIDNKTGEVDSGLSRNGEIIIKGSSIKAIAGDGSTDNCIYLIKSDKTMVDIGGNNLIRNEPDEVIIHLPSSLEKGNYTLSIHTYFSGQDDSLLRQMRCVEFDKMLCVK